MDRPIVAVQFNGLKEIEANLKFLREQFGVRTGGVLIRGLRVGAKLIRDEARSRVPWHIPSGWVPAPKGSIGRGKKKQEVEWSHLLRTNIIEHAIPTSSAFAGGRPTVVVRVRNSGYTRRNGKIVWNRPGTSPGWWWWLEFGTRHSPPRPFMRGAFEAKKQAAAAAAIAAMRKEIEELFKQHLKKAA